MIGPYPGEIIGRSLGDPNSLEAAMASCIADRQCTGVSADWYVDAAFRPLSSTVGFAPDEGSYACTFIVGACEE